MVQSDPVSRRKGPEHIAAYEWMMSYASDVIAERRARQLGLIRSSCLPRSTESGSGARGPAHDDNADHGRHRIPGRIPGDVRAQPGRLPDARRALTADRALIVEAIEESLRYNTSAQRFRRR